MVAGLLACRWAIPQFSTVAYLALSAWALRSPKAALQALTLLWVMMLLNPDVFIAGPLDLSLRWLVMAAAFVGVLGTAVAHPRVIGAPVKWLLAFSCASAILAGYSSNLIVVSLLKLLVFTVGAFTILVGYAATERQRTYWESWLMSVSLPLLVVSAVLYFSDLGFLRNGRDFQGVAGHPQAFAVFVAPLAVWFTGLFFDKRSSRSTVVGALLAWCLLWASHSRTGLLAALIGGALALLVGHMKGGARRAHVLQRFNNLPSLAAALGVIAVGVTVGSAYSTPLSNAATAFVNKYEGESSPFNTRLAVMQNSLANATGHRWTGVGFGTPSNPEDAVLELSDFLGLPVAAPVEKGVIISAAFEEVGVIGTIVLVLFLGSLTRSAASGRHLAAVCLYFTCLILNLGEMVLFSLGGVGLYVWWLIGLTTISRHAHRDRYA